VVSGGTLYLFWSRQDTDRALYYQTTTDLTTWSAKQTVGQQIGVPVQNTTSNFGIAKLASGTWVLGWLWPASTNEGIYQTANNHGYPVARVATSTNLTSWTSSVELHLPYTQRGVSSIGWPRTRPAGRWWRRSVGCRARGRYTGSTHIHPTPESHTCPTLNRRLTTTDASFLYFERPGQPLHIGSCNVYEGRVSVEDVIGVLEDRLHLLPRYRQKVVFAPVGIAHPTWEDDRAFDVRNHVEEVELPEPGMTRRSRAWGAAFSPMLPRDRPLWKMVVLHGRPDGTTAVIWKVHHAMVDGVSVVDLLMTLHDLTRTKAGAAARALAGRGPRRPTDATEDAVRDRLVDAARRWTDEVFGPCARKRRDGGRGR
jgi:hypothetical protein